MSRAQLTSTVEQNTGGAVAPFVAGKNKVINGDFGIWQRGTSFTPSAGTATFTADRFLCNRDGSGATVTVSQQAFTAGSAPVSGYESAYYYQFAQTVAGSGGSYNNVCFQKIEDVRTFAGQTITVSFWAKADSSRTLQVQYNQDFGSGGSSNNRQSIATFNLTTSWQRFTGTITLASISGKTIGTGANLAIEMYGGVNTTQTYFIWGVQLEAGSVATPFTTASNTLQGELALCQRYLPALIGPNQSIVSLATGTTNTFVTIKMPVTARVAPTGITIPSLSLFNVFNGSLSTANPTAISFDSSGTDYVTIAVTTSAGSPTIAAGQADLFRLNSTGAYILFTGCEL